MFFVWVAARHPTLRQLVGPPFLFCVGGVREVQHGASYAIGVLVQKKSLCYVFVVLQHAVLVAVIHRSRFVFMNSAKRYSFSAAEIVQMPDHRSCVCVSKFDSVKGALVVQVLDRRSLFSLPRLSRSKKQRLCTG